MASMTMSNSLPTISDVYFQGRVGIDCVARKLNEARLIWRETPNPDAGIDGQIEYIDGEGCVTGALVAAQVKSGRSYFEKMTPEHIIFYPARKHRKYWRDFAIPVVLILHDPESGQCYFVDARNQLRTALTDSDPIHVPLKHTLNNGNRDAIFDAYGPSRKLLNIDEVAVLMANSRLDASNGRLSFMELYLGGLIDIGNKLFFSTDLCMDLIDLAHVFREDPDRSFSWGPTEYDFMDQYVQFLSGQQLVYLDYADYIVDRDHRGVIPISIWTLTRRGKALLHFVYMVAKQIGEEKCVEESNIGIETSDVERKFKSIAFSEALLDLFAKKTLSENDTANTQCKERPHD